MPEITGNAIDQLITIEAKNRGMPHNVLAPMYAAARALNGGKPIAMEAAQRLKTVIAPGDTVLILTGAGYQPTMPNGESDGPPGAASLGKVLYKGFGAVPVFVTEECHAGPVFASSQAAGLMVKSFVDARDRHLGAALETAPLTQDAIPAWIDELYARTKPKAVISTERLGPGIDGIMHTATALPLSGPDTVFPFDAVDISPIVMRAKDAGLLTIGIGDHGNELGFGAIREAVLQAMPKGEKLCTTVATDIVLPVMMSNWGCYGIEAALAFLLGRPELMHGMKAEERILRACLDAGGVEAMFCTNEFFVDGLDGETSMACVQFLGNIVRKNLEAGTTGLTH
ncbi:glutamate cyclase domain-containing protein [Chelatococcus sp. GCM10030263]|uniref:glutamate cyclase domain-containing protein n=1 Tax=Chelatococcus sp. GCM10030263 TaxID=3273387 RepID=UPI00360E3570